MKRALTYAVAAGLVLGTSSLSLAQTGPSGTQTPGARVGGAQGQSGMSTAPQQNVSPETEAQVKSALEAHGFTNVSEVKQQGDRITANAMKDGQKQKVVINTTAGTLQSGPSGG